MPERIFVDVNTDIARTGYLSPRSITWKDGRVFRIEEIRLIRPASTVMKNLPGVCYTVVVGGKIRHLFFERGDGRFPAVLGRWYVTV